MEHPEPDPAGEAIRHEPTTRHPSPFPADSPERSGCRNATLRPDPPPLGSSEFVLVALENSLRGGRRVTLLDLT